MSKLNKLLSLIFGFSYESWAYLPCDKKTRVNRTTEAKGIKFFATCSILVNFVWTSWIKWNFNQSHIILCNLVQFLAILCYLWLNYTYIYENIMPLLSKTVQVLWKYFGSIELIFSNLMQVESKYSFTLKYCGNTLQLFYKYCNFLNKTRLISIVSKPI